MLGNFFTTNLMDDSNDLSDKNAGFEFASPHACKTVSLLNAKSVIKNRTKGLGDSSWTTPN